MAKITGPLYSHTAHGMIGARLTFSNRTTGQQARFQNAQKDVITTKRTIQRAKFNLGLELWNSLPPNEKNYWTQAGNDGFVYI